MRLLLIVYTFVFLSIGLPIAAQTTLNFTWDVDEGCVPLAVRFAIDTNSVLVLPSDIAEWNFGNGQTLTAAATDTVETIFREIQSAYEVNLTISGSVLASSNIACIAAINLSSSCFDSVSVGSIKKHSDTSKGK